VLFVGLPLALILAFGGGWFLARRSLAPLAVMAARASDISARSLSQRLPVANPQDELGRLGSVFNQMLGRLEASFEELRRFAADASHELRTPLTALRTVGEVALREKPSEARLRETLGAMLEDAQRMQDLVESLLVFARAEADTQPLQRLPIRCESLIQEVAENLRVLAEAKQQQLLVEFGTDAVVMGDPGLLREAVLNVVHNAIRYTPPGGRVTIRGRDRKGEVHLEVEDTGTGIAVEHRPHVFERFYRVDPSRSRAEGGAGLGLAIARASIERHGGRIDLESVSPRGCLFRITLPVPDRESSDVRVGAD
jgi:heavy metal sensor kinase